MHRPMPYWKLLPFQLFIMKKGQFVPGPAHHAHINPFEGANLDRRSLDFIGIDPF